MKWIPNLCKLLLQAWLHQNIRFLLFVFFILPLENSCSLIWSCCTVHGHSGRGGAIGSIPDSWRCRLKCSRSSFGTCVKADMSTTFEWSELTSGATLWSVCSEDVGSHYSTLYPTMKEVYLKLLSAGLRALVYNGDTDMACNFLGDQWFVEDLGFEVRPWLFSFSFPLMNGIDFTFKCAVNVCFSADHTLPALDVWAPGRRLLSTVWKPHFPDSEGNNFRVLFSSSVYSHGFIFFSCPFSGCGSHGSSVGSRPSISLFSVLPEQRVLLSACVAHLHSPL